MKQFKLQDLMTAEQAIQLIDLLNKQSQEIEDLKKEVENLKNAQSRMTWDDIYIQTEIYKIYKGD